MNSYFLNQTYPPSSCAGAAAIDRTMTDTEASFPTTDPISDWLVVLI